MFEKIINWSNKKINILSLIDFKLLGISCIFLGAFLSQSIIPIQEICAKYYLVLSVIVAIKPLHKIFFKKDVEKKSMQKPVVVKKTPAIKPPVKKASAKKTTTKKPVAKKNTKTKK